MENESVIATLQHAWNGGGFWMYPIAISLMFAIAIGIERVMTLFVRARVNKDEFVAELTKLIMAGNLQGAITFVSSQKKTPLVTVVKAGIIKSKSNDQVIQSALDEATLRELPRLEKRTGYLAVIANLSMLLGLLGTVVGLIKCFAAVSKPGVDPSLKSVILADGIAEAMNCTAFGLLSAITALILFGVLSGKTQHLVDDINETAVSVMNLIVNNRDKLKA